MNAVRGILWEQWRQSRLWMVGTGAFMVLLTIGVGLNRAWIMRHSSNDPFELSMLPWVVCFTALGLLFVDQRLREVTLHFPRRQFALPCRTSSLVASHLLYKSAMAVLLGATVAVYHWVLWDQPGPSALAMALFLALVSVTQAIIMLAAVIGPWPAGLAGVSAGWLALLFYYGLREGPRLDEADAAMIVAVVLSVAGWIVAFANGPAARHGRRERRRLLPHFSYDNSTLSLHLARPMLVHWEFTSPLWAHCWYEWGRVLVWVHRIVLPATAILTIQSLVGGNSELALAMLYMVTVATAFACSYFLLRISSSEARFLLARPGGERTLVNGKLLSALLTAVLVTALAAAIIGLLALVAMYMGPNRTAAAAIRALPWLAPAMAALIWVTLTSGPIYLACAVVGWILALGLMAPVTWLTALGVDEVIVGLIVIPPVAGLLYAGVRWLRQRGIPIPWELSLVAIPGVIEFVARGLSVALLLPTTWFDVGNFDARMGFLCPLFLLLGGLLFARRIGLISGLRLAFAYIGHAAVSLLFIVIMANGASLGPLTAPDVVFWWIAACFAPILWIPLIVRLQRYR